MNLMYLAPDLQEKLLVAVQAQANIGMLHRELRAAARAMTEAK